MCQVYNGNSMKSTFASTKRTEALWTSLDPRDIITSEIINGSGKIYQKTFWLDIGERYKNYSNDYLKLHSLAPCRSSEAYKPNNPWPRGSATLNINEWLKYFNVRSSPIDLVAGASYIIQMTPIQHTATSAVRNLDRQTRRCLYKDEQELKKQ